MDTSAESDTSVGQGTPSNTLTSVQETPSTDGTQRRWNLRERKSVGGGAPDSDAESPMDTSNQSEESPVQPKATTSRGPKRGGKKLQATPAKRKAVTTKANTSGSGKGSPLINAEAMFNAISSGKSAVKSVASEWVDRYERDAELAMLELVQFLIRCCGCKARITEEMFKSDTTDTIMELTKKFSESSYEYPLTMTGPQQKKFKNNFCEFIWRLVEQCQHSTLYDKYMLDTLIIWTVGFTDSQVRAFRHTSSLAGVKLVSALVTIANSVNSDIDNTQLQVEAERKRQLSKKTEAGLASLEILLSKQTELKKHKVELEDFMKGLFSSIFVHRCRDVRPEIRALCINELGVWLKDYSIKFLSDSYLKYIGWMVYDKVGEVRLTCIKVLETLYGDSDIAPHLELFTEKFKERLMSMRLDTDDNVATSAIAVLGHMADQSILDGEECQEVCELIFIENKGIAHAAGQFAVNYLFSDDFMRKAKLKKVPKGHRKLTDGEIMLNELVKFFVEVKIHDHSNYFVDSLWDYTDVLQDWESMTTLLLDDKCGIKLSETDEGVLVEIMSCAIRRATGTNPPAGRAKGRVISNKEKKAMEDSKQELSTHFMNTLPELMQKFGSTAQNATNFANIPRQFELELYAESRLQKQLESLLTHMHQLTMMHHDPDVLTECALTFKYLMDPDFSLHSTSEHAFKVLMEEMVDTFKQQLEAGDDNTLTDEEDEDCFAVSISTRRLATFYKHIDVGRFEFTEEMGTLLEEGAKKGYSEKVLENAIVCMTHEVMWEMQEMESSGTYERESLRKVRSIMMKLFKSCEHLLKFATGPAQRQAFVTFADLLVVFSRHLASHEPALAGLVYEPDFYLQDSLQDYVVHQILNSPEDEQDTEPESEEEALLMAERLNDRRVQLAAFLKLGMYHVIDMVKLAPIWAEYIRQYPNFGDLIKFSLNRCREKSPVFWYRTVFSCLKNSFLQYKNENSYVNQLSGEWFEIKDLAKKFAMSMGFEPTKVRRPLVGIHREGIQFALTGLDSSLTLNELDDMDPPPNIDFLMILNEFSHRLLAVDRTGERGVVSFLDEQLPEGLVQCIKNKTVQGWDSLMFYHRHTSTAPVNKGRTTGGAAAVPRPGAISQSRAKKRSLKIMNESMLSDTSSITRPIKVSRLGDTPPSMDLSEGESVAETPTLRRSKRNTTTRAES